MRVRQLLFILSSVVLTLAVFEGGLRLLNYPYIGCKELDEVAEYQIGQFDPVLGWSYKPSYSVRHWDNKTYSFSVEGYRSLSTEDHRDPSKPTILVVGDSFLFGHGLDFEETFGYKLEDALNHSYNVLNFAVQGYGLDQVYLQIRQLMDVYAPLYVVVDVHEDQDYRNINRDRRAFFPCSKLTGTKPVFSLKNGMLVQTHIPERFESYDNPRLRLVLRRVGEVLNQRGNGKMALSQKIYEEMRRYVESHGAKLFEINYQLGIRDYQIDPYTSSASAIIVDYGNEYLVDGVHPNGLATTRMVREFLDRFGAQIK